jgi:hypothetical protein
MEERILTVALYIPGGAYSDSYIPREAYSDSYIHG